MTKPEPRKPPVEAHDRPYTAPTTSSGALVAPGATTTTTTAGAVPASGGIVTALPRTPPVTDRPYLADMRTLTGIPLAEAFALLDALLPAQAYKPITGGKGQAIGLTDINPGFLPSVLLETFGPFGLGWGFAVEEQTYDAGYSHAKLSVWYAYRDPAHGEPVRSRPITVTGGSANSQREWAEKGAVTNALGTAWFFLGYQTSVYQGRRSHTDAGKAQATTLKELSAALAAKIKLTEGEEILRWVSGMLGRKVESSAELSEGEARDLIDRADAGKAPA